MPSILFYALDADLTIVLDHLNADSSIAFIVADGARRWRGVERRDTIPAGHHLLWHRPGGPPPLVGPGKDGVIADPMAGWTERAASAIPGVPFFGSVPMIIAWDVARERSGAVPMSAFGWIGDRYRAIGLGASKDTTRWWKALQKWVSQQTREFPRGGSACGEGGLVAAFPGAAARLKTGTRGELNPPTP
jgi:hypothetical protein